MLVDDKLAKEKLILEIDQMCHFNYRVFYFELANAIRNTDLTDCQPKSGLNIAAAAAFHPLAKVVDADEALAAIADQGSVRNATDIERCAKVALDAADEWRKHSRDMQAEGVPDPQWLHMNTLASGAEIVWGRIRALPVLDQGT